MTGVVLVSWSLTNAPLMTEALAQPDALRQAASDDEVQGGKCHRTWQENCCCDDCNFGCVIPNLIPMIAK